MRDDKGRLRRNDQDVTGTVQTTDADEVAAEVVRIFSGLFGETPAHSLQRAFRDIAHLYSGQDPQYFPCDTEYHDVQHVLEVTLAMARLMDGYQRAKADAEASLTPELFTLGVVIALFHDVGYLRRRTDHYHRYGAEYTVTHVSRSAAFLRRYMVELGLRPLARTASALVHYTGYERPAEKIRVSSTLPRRLGQMLGTADIIAQMSDRCYLEKCRDRLYPEFVLARLAAKQCGVSALPAFASGDDLVHKTPGFYADAARRLDVQLARTYAYAECHFGGANFYLEAIRKNVQYAQLMAQGDNAAGLRRLPPSTLAAGVEPYPKGLLSQPVSVAGGGRVTLFAGRGKTAWAKTSGVRAQSSLDGIRRAGSFATAAQATRG